MTRDVLEYCLELSPQKSTEIATALERDKIIPMSNMEKGDIIEKPLLEEAERQFRNDPDLYDAELILNGKYGRGFDIYIRHKYNGCSTSLESKHIFSSFHRGNVNGNYYNKRAFRVIQGKEIINKHETAAVWGNMSGLLKEELEEQDVTVYHHSQVVRTEQDKERLRAEVTGVIKNWLQQSKKILGLKKPNALNLKYKIFKICNDGNVLTGTIRMNPTTIDGNIVSLQQTQLGVTLSKYSLRRRIRQLVAILPPSIITFSLFDSLKLPNLLFSPVNMSGFLYLIGTLL